MNLKRQKKLLKNLEKYQEQTRQNIQIEDTPVDWHKIFGTPGTECPPKNKLEEYRESPHRDEEIEKHLSVCPTCVDEMLK